MFILFRWWYLNVCSLQIMVPRCSSFINGGTKMCAAIHFDLIFRLIPYFSLSFSPLYVYFFYIYVKFFDTGCRSGFLFLCDNWRFSVFYLE